MVLDNSWNWRFPVGFSSVNALNWKSCLNRFTLSSSWKPYPHNSFKFCLWLIFHGSFKVLIFQYLWFQILLEISYLEGKISSKLLKRYQKPWMDVFFVNIEQVLAISNRIGFILLSIGFGLKEGRSVRWRHPLFITHKIG